jgi:hypothetical protein
MTYQLPVRRFASGEPISSFYAAAIGAFDAQVRTENPRLNEGHLRSGLPFSRDPVPDCVDDQPHQFRSRQSGIGSRHGINICTVCGLGSIYDSA